MHHFVSVVGIRIWGFVLKRTFRELSLELGGVFLNVGDPL